ncbi:MAG TPA: ribonuclease E inhibitor RraB [Thermoanaerobaculia bacterium]
MAESLIDQELLTHLARNEELIELFLKNGGDLEDDRPVDFFFYAASEEAAEALAADLRTIGLDDVAVLEEDEGRWAVQGVKQTSVAAVTDPAFVEKLVRAAANQLAEFDGWGAPV